MRNYIFMLAVSLSASTAFALEYPEPADPVAKAFVSQYMKDKERLEDSLFTIPSPAPGWPCAVPEIEQYRAAGLHMAHPELKRDIDKETRKLFRAQGMSPSSVPVTTYSNVRIIPLKAQCTAGKLTGELKLLISYDSRMESKTTDANGTMVTLIDSQDVVFTEQVIDASPQHISSKRFAKSKVRITSSSDNPKINEMMKEYGQDGADAAPVLSINYIGPYGSSFNFSETQTPSTGGLFGGKSKTVLNSHFMTKADEHSGRSEHYTDKLLISTVATRDNLSHGVQTTYTENYLKKSNLRLSQIPGMEGAKEVTINGVDLIENTMCFQHGAVVKISPCPGT